MHSEEVKHLMHGPSFDRVMHMNSAKVELSHQSLDSFLLDDPIIHGKRKSEYFKPDHKIALVITCQDYSSFRKLEGKEGY